MYIKSLIYEDQSTDWKLELIEFKPLTLLVGASGVGKTRILKALLNLKKIANGSSLNGLKWEIEFSTSDGRDCKWSGKFENRGFVSDVTSEILANEEKINSPIDNEQLFIDRNLVVDRNEKNIVFNKEKTVKLSQKESVISLLREEDQINEIYKNFQKILFEDNSVDGIWFGYDLFEIRALLNKFKSLNSIRNSKLDIKTKLYLLYKNQNSLFKAIVESFADIFPYVEDVRIEGFNNDYKDSPLLHRILLFIEIKEKNIPNWIGESKISLGMWKTLMHIAELYLCEDDTVILIDEFENSLGINCIDQITHSILASERNLQFIITSHHPYIINNIGVSHWKIITRNGNIVTATDAEKFGIGQSKHQAFTQLINLDAYTDGIVN